MQGLQYDSARHNDAFLVYAVVDCYFSCWVLDPWVSHGERIMNERIEQLKKQAHIERRQEYFSSVVDPTIKSVSVTRHFDLNLFAELIVKETLRVTGATPSMTETAKNHFGVE
jgi:hypothetical protein